MYLYINIFVVINTGSGPAATEVQLSTAAPPTDPPSPASSKLVDLQDKVKINKSAFASSFSSDFSASDLICRLSRCDH